MKKNLPVTNKEIKLKENDTIISTTDKKGQITYINNTFLEISGFTEQELVGQSHNIVRHPDMPPEAFEDLWNTVKSGKTWTGIVKNRCKNGDHYWVEAFVSPVFQGDQLVGYQSVRSKPANDQIVHAEVIYEKLNTNAIKKLPHKKSIQNTSIRFRLFSALFIAGILPLSGDALRAMNLISETLMMTLVLGAPIILVISAILLQLTVFKPLENISSTLSRISGGDLSQQIKIKSKDEVGELQLNVKIMQARLQMIIGKISEVSDKTNQQATTLSSSSHETVDMITAQYGHSEELMASMNDISNITQQVVTHTEQAVTAVDEASSEANTGKQIVIQARESIHTLESEIQQSAQVISDLDIKSKDISSIIDVIRGIAEQTNLLALNAAIEAARAGETGRGFAVVADEVRTLAGRTQDATIEINNLVESLQQGVTDAVVKIEKGTEQATSAVEAVEHSEKSLDAINQTINKISDMNNEISDATVIQFQSSTQANQNVSMIKELSGSILDIAKKNSEDSNNMIEISNDLNRQFKAFKLT